MSDDKKVPDLGGIDWDDALDEWEKNTFVEVAKDAESAKDLRGKSPADDELGTLIAKSPKSTAPAPAEGRPPTPGPISPRAPGAGGATVKSKGGLGQLFSRKSSIPAPLSPTSPSRPFAAVPVMPAAPPVPRTNSEDETEVFTSASVGPSARSFSTTGETESIPIADPDATSDFAATGEHPADDNEPTGFFKRDSSKSLQETEEQSAAPAPRSIPRPRGADDSVTVKLDMPASVPPQPPSSPPPELSTEVEEEPELDEATRELRIPHGMDAELAKTLRDSARWLTEEARATTDRDERVRVELAASEVWAILGDESRARSCAEQAHAANPQHALAARQRRQTGASDDEFKMTCLRQEADTAETPAARASAALLLADMSRVLGDRDGAIESLRRACSYDPSDVRGPIALAGYALAMNDHTSPLLTVEITELAEIGNAIEIALELREVDRKARAPEKPSPNQPFFRAKTAFESRARDGVMSALADVKDVPELANAVTWLSASIGAGDTPTRKKSIVLLAQLAAQGNIEARVALALRGAELNDPDTVAKALGDDGALPRDDRLALVALGLADAAAFQPSEARPIEAAIAGAIARDAQFSNVVAAEGPAHASVRLARSLVRGASREERDAALADARDDAAARPVALELAMRAGKLTQVAETLVEWAGGDQGGSLGASLVAGLLSERAGDVERAASAYKAARAFSQGSDGLVRLAGAVDDGFDIAFALDSASEHAKTPFASAVMRLEAAERTRRAGADPTELLGRSHQADPAMGVASFLLQRGARRRGDADDVLFWLAERSKASTDPLEGAIESVREALFLVDRDPEGSRERLESAHAARPADFALRELLERLAPQSASSSAEWRARHALSAPGPSRTVRFLEAALLAEAGEARRYAREAAATGDSFARVVLEEAEIASGETSRLVEQLMLEARTGSSALVQREAYERLAILDSQYPRENATPDAWHRAIVELEPDYLPSLVALEQLYLASGDDLQLEPVAEKLALLLGGTPGGECASHAQLAVRLKLRLGASDWEGTRPLVELAAQQAEPPLWAIRARNAHARVTKSAQALLETSLALAERTTRPPEIAALMRRASESALELKDEKSAKEHLERAALEDPGDAVTWGLLADARERAGDTRGAAEACESLARTSTVESHQLLAWYDAAKLWIDAVGEHDRGVTALEQAANIDVAFEDVFSRLSAAYSARRNDAELAALLSRRLERATDPDERVTLEVDRARALAEIGDLDAAQTALAQALEARPDHTTALSAYADLCEKMQRYEEAEKAWVRLARLLSTPEEQRVVYDRLGVLYSQYAVNLARAEVALKEVLKRAPGDVPTLERLVDVYRNKNDAPHAAETMQELVALSEDEDTRLRRLVALAEIHENVGHELRKAEQVLEGVRKEFPTSVAALRALAEFYARQKQIPAMHILLDRAAGDARRAFAGGRFVTSLFQVLAAAYELRGKKDAAQVVGATLAALEGASAKIRGAEMRAFDPRLDDVLAPEVLSPGLRALLNIAGDALDQATPVDLRTLRANSLSQSSPVFSMANAIASSMGVQGLQVLVSSQLGKTCIPCGSNPPMIVVGEALVQATNDRAKAFLLSRSLKAVRSRASALVRGQPQDLVVLITGWLAAFNPGWKPPGVNQQVLNEALRRIQPVMPRITDPQAPTIALELAAGLGAQAGLVGPAALAWTNRCALLAIGDPGSAVEAIAWTNGLDGAPKGAEERVAWAARTVEVRELLVFSVSDAYAEARTRLGLDR